MPDDRAQPHRSSSIQIEMSVGDECRTTAAPTGGFAIAQRPPSRIVRVMALDCALAHKLAAWNERRLLRDLNDCYFLGGRLGDKPDLEVISRRLAKVESRLPRLRKRERMTRDDLAVELRATLNALTMPALRKELAPILPVDELVGLVPRIRSAVVRIAELLELEEDSRRTP